MSFGSDLLAGLPGAALGVATGGIGSLLGSIMQNAHPSNEDLYV